MKEKQETETWNLKDVLNENEEKEFLEKIRENVKTISSMRTLLQQKKPEDILKIIELELENDKLMSRIGAYYSLKISENIEDEESLAKMNYISQLETELVNQTLFFELKLISLEPEEIETLKKDEKLKEYQEYFSHLQKLKEHVKNEEIEQIINLKNDTSYSFSKIYDLITTNFKFNINDELVTQEEAASKFSSPNPEERKKAYDSVLGRYKEESTILGEIYKDIVLTWHNEKIKIRNYEKPISSRNQGNKVTDKAVQALLESIRENTKIFEEYFILKHKLLKIKGSEHEFSRYHLYAPLNFKEEKYDYETSKKISLETYKEFDELFYEHAKKIFEEKHIHSHPKPKKRSGAYCYSMTNDITPYIMLNHSNTLKCLFTMMHELGHGIHTLFSKKQNQMFFHAKIPLAETASIFGEMLLAQRLLKQSNQETKSQILIKMLDNQYASIIRQGYFVIFEQWMHENITRSITKKDIDEKYYSLLKEQFGQMNIPEIYKHEWNYIPHIHHTPFYCYAYAWGNLLVLSLYKMYEEQGEPFKEKLVELLSAGSSKPTTEILKNIGFNPELKESWNQGFQIIKKEIEELKRINNIQ